MSIPVSEFDKWHTCGAPGGCKRRLKKYYFACAQHRSLLGWDLNCRLQTAWRERHFDPARWQRTRAEAFRKWGWKPEYPEMPETIVTPEITKRLQDGDIARRALKWMMEHRVYWDRRAQTFYEAVYRLDTRSPQRPICLPPEDVALYLFDLSREVDLGAEHAG